MPIESRIFIIASHLLNQSYLIILTMSTMKIFFSFILSSFRYTPGMASIITIQATTQAAVGEGVRAARALAGALNRLTFLSIEPAGVWPRVVAENVPADGLDRLAAALRLVMPPGVSVIVLSDVRPPSENHRCLAPGPCSCCGSSLSPEMKNA